MSWKSLTWLAPFNPPLSWSSAISHQTMMVGCKLCSPLSLFLWTWKKWMWRPIDPLTTRLILCHTTIAEKNIADDSSGVLTWSSSFLVESWSVQSAPAGGTNVVVKSRRASCHSSQYFPDILVFYVTLQFNLKNTDKPTIFGTSMPQCRLSWRLWIQADMLVSSY